LCDPARSLRSRQHSSRGHKSSQAFPLVTCASTRGVYIFKYFIETKLLVSCSHRVITSFHNVCKITAAYTQSNSSLLL